MKEVDIDDFGAQLTPLTDKEKSTYELNYGLVVTNIKKGKLMDAGISKGMIILVVNDEKMVTVEDWENIVKNTNKSKDRTLWIRAITSSGRKVSFVVDMNEK